MGRRLLDHEEEDTSPDIPQQLFAQNNNNNDPARNTNGAVMLELEEQKNNVVRTEPTSAAMFQVRTVFQPMGGGIQYYLIPTAENGGNIFLRNVGIYLQIRTMLQPRIPTPSASGGWLSYVAQFLRGVRISSRRRRWNGLLPCRRPKRTACQ
jgi:hypothetical protein